MSTGQAEITREYVIAEIRRIAQANSDSTLSFSAFRSATGVSPHHIYRLFDGWREACEAAGLRPNMQNIAFDEDVLFEEMRRVFIECKGLCTRTKFARLARYSADTYRTRWGRWGSVLTKFQEWLDRTGREFPFKDQLMHDAPAGELNLDEPIAALKSRRQWPTLDVTTYGPLLNFRGLQHAPVNEQGVVFLFGMVCAELGFLVEAVRTGYPDCKAKRRVHRSRDQWQDVRIEFEFRSSEFKAHGHDPQVCDLIVCWEHDWSACPLEVVELKTEIGKLDSHAAQRSRTQTRGPDA
jgi:hypothetical protein